MAFIITVAQRKGGAGKTTLCCQLTAALAQRGVDVAALDLDDQKSFSNWAATRARRLGRLDFSFETGGGFGLSSSLRRAGAAADIVIVDTPPTIDSDVRRAVSAADLVIAPMQLSPLDLEASIPTARMIGDARKPALFVVNRAPPRARIADRIREKSAECELPVASTELGNRAGYAESLATGRSVVEADRRNPAADEINALTDEISALVGIEARSAA